MYRVKKVTITEVPAPGVRPGQAPKIAPKPAQKPEDMTIEAQELIGVAMKSLYAAKAFEAEFKAKKDMRKQRRRAEEHKIIEFLIQYLNNKE